MLMVVVDDVGFAQLGCFGAGFETPNIDRVAADGLRYQRFHVTSVCSATRAALLTGRNHHAVGMGVTQEAALGFPGYHGRDRVRLRQRAAASSPALRGRVLDTITSWEHTVASALAERGEPAADVLAAVGVAVFRSAITAWLRDGGDLVAHVERGFDALDERSG
ncbi:Arylsulfatase A and related enzymes-like protein [Nocardioides sp. JS614]|nr:Arylsulfatase A and related enzymes-like protein [Nocardioides sp. JS614]